MKVTFRCKECGLVWNREVETPKELSVEHDHMFIIDGVCRKHAEQSYGPLTEEMLGQVLNRVACNSSANSDPEVYLAQARFVIRLLEELRWNPDPSNAREWLLRLAKEDK